MAYAVYTTERFDREISKLSDFDKDIIQKAVIKLKDNPYVGDPIRYKFFREKRIREKRFYFLVYDSLSAVLVVAFGGKKIQQDTINEIISLLPEYEAYIKEIIRN